MMEKRKVDMVCRRCKREKKKTGIREKTVCDFCILEEDLTTCENMERISRQSLESYMEDMHETIEATKKAKRKFEMFLDTEDERMEKPVDSSGRSG